jgi:hypothetical protein
VKAIAETDGELEDTIVSSKDKNVTRGIENCGAYLAVFEMPLNQFLCFGRQGIVEISGDVVPNMFALYDH